MNLLLDTHVLLWWWQGSARLGDDARDRIADPGTAVWVSAATAWEMAIKEALGRLELPEAPEEFVPREIAQDGFRPLAISVAHALAVGTLPRHHGDPFDRLLITQARIEDLVLVSSDAAFEAYDVRALTADR